MRDLVRVVVSLVLGLAVASATAGALADGPEPAERAGEILNLETV